MTTFLNKLFVPITNNGLIASRGKLLRSLALLGAIAVSTPTTVLAVPVLDQSFDAVGGGAVFGPNIFSDQASAQTFTVGVMGLLTQVDVQLRTNPLDLPTGDAILSILSTAAGIPSASLGSVSIPQASVPPFSPATASFVGVDISGLGLIVNVGDVLAIELTFGGPGSYTWLAAFGDQYAGGAEFDRNPPGTTWFGPFATGDDTGFQTFVDPIPEPATLLLMGLGLAGLGFARRRRLNA